MPKRKAASSTSQGLAAASANATLAHGPSAKRARRSRPAQTSTPAFRDETKPDQRVGVLAAEDAQTAPSEKLIAVETHIETKIPRARSRRIARTAQVAHPIVAKAESGSVQLDKPDDQDMKENETDEEEDSPHELINASTRPPPINSPYLPLPWEGRLGYACLNTYLRNSTPSVFSSRTTRIASIIEHRHPLADPNLPEHPLKNRPDKSKPADPRLGQRFVEKLCLANVGDIAKMIRWNERYGIKFMRLSSEMFPFASHAEHGYKLAPFAADALAEAGKIIAEYGHRVTTHPGQFTQLGSPRKQVIDASFRDLEYHDEMLSLLQLPAQQDRDAVMILHMGGTFGDKMATIGRFKDNYAKLSPGVRNRLVLENDDVCWSVHDLLPVCEELNIPFVLDFHHHNIVFDSEQIREGTLDICEYFPRILRTWQKKDITPKMHYSEPTAAAITPKQRRKHSPRVATLPPCPNNMDLMIEAKDKEQAVFELMRTFKLPGWDKFNNMIPHVREDNNKVLDQAKRKVQNRPSKSSKLKHEGGMVEQIQDPPPSDRIPDEEVGMGGSQRRVYWPPGMEEWLRPQKRIVQTKSKSARTTTEEQIV